MSKNHKSGRRDSSQPALFEMQPADIHPKERERVSQLIALNKSGLALDFAKDVHKRCHSAASEGLLLDAYGARLASLVERGLDREAKALMVLVRERYPSSSERLGEWNAALAARRGDWSAFLEPLNDPSLPAEKRAAIAAKVRRDGFDLRALAECRTLPPEHPLRTAAAALHKAFTDVTSGPVADDAGPRDRGLLSARRCVVREMPGGGRRGFRGCSPSARTAYDGGREAAPAAGSHSSRRGAGERGRREP
jgi:hypothetical protein